jgi:hypothetical protein
LGILKYKIKEVKFGIHKALITGIFLLIVSCNDSEKSEQGKISEEGIISKSWKNVKSGVRVPFEYFEERSRKADSARQASIVQYYEKQRNIYPEYLAAENWFNSNPPELLGLEGNYYKIIEGTIQNGRSIRRSHFVKPTDGKNYLYFFRSEERFFILELQIENDVSCLSVRCIIDGWGDQPMYDYLYDEKGNLVEEVFQADVEPSFYEEDGNLYFEYANNDIVNTVLLGPTI